MAHFEDIARVLQLLRRFTRIGVAGFGRRSKRSSRRPSFERRAKWLIELTPLSRRRFQRPEGPNNLTQ